MKIQEVYFSVIQDGEQLIRAMFLTKTKNPIKTLSLLQLPLDRIKKNISISQHIVLMQRQ